MTKSIDSGEDKDVTQDPAARPDEDLMPSGQADAVGTDVPAPRPSAEVKEREPSSRPGRSARFGFVVGSVASLLVAALAVGSIYYFGGPEAPAPAPSASTGQSAGASAPVNRSAPLTGEAGFLSAIHSMSGASSYPDSYWLGLGQQVCNATGTPGITRQALIDGATSTGRFTASGSATVVDSANTHLCPGRRYSSAPDFRTLPQDGANSSGAPSAPASSFTDGTYEVGNEPGQIRPGTYRTPGGSSRGSCYFARLASITGDDIIDNDLSSGPMILSVQSSDGAVRLSGGCTWTRR